MSAVAVTLREWETRRPEPGSPLVGLSLAGQPAAQRLAERLTDAGQLEVRELRHGLELRAAAYVGHLNLGALTVTIQPKLTGTPLLTLLRYAYGLRELKLFERVATGAAPQTFQDLLIQQLTAEVAELLARGLHREYERVTEPLASPRGKLDFIAYTRQEGAGRATLPCIHHPRLAATLLNQVVLAGLGFAATLTADLELRTRLRRLEQTLALDVSPRHLDGNALHAAQRALDRRTVAYEPSLTLLELLWQSAGMAWEETAPALRLPGLLFDMNRFFQALLSRFLHTYLAGYTVQDEYRLQDLFAYDPAHNPHRRRPPTPRPDFVVQRAGRVVAVLDAKYRDLWEQPLPREMLYQLALYALSHAECRQAVILYPTLDAAAVEQRIHIHEPPYGAGRAQIVLRPVNLLRLADLLQSPHTRAREAKCIAWARRLALGQDAASVWNSEVKR